MWPNTTIQMKKHYQYNGNPSQSVYMFQMLLVTHYNILIKLFAPSISYGLFFSHTGSLSPSGLNPDFQMLDI